MNITYKGKTREFTGVEQQKLDVKFARIGKLVDRKGERKVHVAVTSTRHLHKAEIQMNFEEHPLVGIASDPDFYQAVSAAVDKLRDHRGPQVRISARLESVTPPTVSKGPKKNDLNGASNGRSSQTAKVYRVANQWQSKPMTIDEALLKIKREHNYFAFIESGSGKLGVLIRRPDGHFDLVEG